MKKFVFLFCAVALGVIASCEKNTELVPESTVVYLTASTQELSKVSADKAGAWTWEKGDVIGVWTGSVLTPFTLDAESAGKASGRFAGTLPAGEQIDENTIAVYPYESAAFDGTTLSWSFDRWGAGIRNVMMYGDVKDAKIGFKHLGGVARVVIENVPVGCDKIFFETGPSTKFYCVGAKADLTAAVPALSEASGNDFYCVHLPAHTEVIPLQEVYVPMIPGTYTSTEGWTDNRPMFRAVYKKSDNSDWKDELDAGFMVTGYLTRQGESVSIAAGDLVVLPTIQKSKVGTTLAGDFQFLKDIVENRRLGDKTPEVTEDQWKDCWALRTIFDAGGLGIEMWGDHITNIQNPALESWPESMDLKEVVVINFTGKDKDHTALYGKELPKYWNTPKAERIILNNIQMTGVLPETLASRSKSLLYLDISGNDFYGALPHDWASSCLERVIMVGYEGGYAGAANDKRNKDLGYIVPAGLDVVLNSERSGKLDNDKTQLKLAGGGNWIGFEKGFGQRRYELFDPNAVIGDLETWSPYRKLFDATSAATPSDAALAGEGNNQNSWQWYYSDFAACPEVLLDWNQADADAFTAAKKAAHAL